MNDIPTIINNIKDWVVYPFFYGLAVVIFIYAGILFVTSAGDPGKITRAKQAVIIGVIGVFIGVSAGILAGFIRYLLYGA